jgi:hypothetical protein
MAYNTLDHLISSYWNKIDEVACTPHHNIERIIRWVWTLNDIEGSRVDHSKKWFSNKEECYKDALCNRPSFDVVRDSPVCVLTFESVCATCQVNGCKVK